MSTATLASPPAHSDVVFLRDVTWSEYCRLRESAENRGVRMYYAHGSLLLVTTGSLHERLSRLTALALLAWTEARDLDLMSLGRWTLREDVREQGLEADDCYYLTQLPLVQGKAELDLSVDPPPDLAIEIDITTHAAHKFAIYRALGVKELWVWKGDRLRVYRLTRGGYQAGRASVELPGFPFAAVSRLILAHIMEGDRTALRALRELFHH